jgi:hypothetical protein
LGLFKEELPVHDTIDRLITRIDPSALQSTFIRCRQEVVKPSEGEVVAVDGKRLRSSYDRQSAIHMVSAFADLLNLLDIKGCLIIIDAMGCQRKITQTIIDKEADHLIALKGKQQRLFDNIKQAFACANKTATPHMEKEHGRVKAREYHVLDRGGIAKAFPDWTGLKSIGMAINYQHNGQKESLEYRYLVKRH